MWAKVNTDSNSVEEIIRFPKSIVANNIKYGKDIFKKWTWSKLNAIGLYELVDNGTKGDDAFQITSQPTYTFNSGEKNVTTSYTVTDRELNDTTNEDSTTSPGLKTQQIEKTKHYANALLQRFDWLATRKIMDSSKNIPTAVTNYCSSIRSDCDDIVTAINNASNMTEFKALYQDTLDGDGNVTQVNRINRWTDDSNVLDYAR